MDPNNSKIQFVSEWTDVLSEVLGCVSVYSKSLDK